MHLFFSSRHHVALRTRLIIHFIARNAHTPQPLQHRNGHTSRASAARHAASVSVAASPSSARGGGGGCAHLPVEAAEKDDFVAKKVSCVREELHRRRHVVAVCARVCMCVCVCVCQLRCAPPNKLSHCCSDHDQAQKGVVRHSPYFRPSMQCAAHTPCCRAWLQSRIWNHCRCPSSSAGSRTAQASPAA